MSRNRSVRFSMCFAQKYVSRTITFTVDNDDKKCKADQGADGQTRTNYQILVALLCLSSWCLVMVERLFLAVPRGCLRFVIVVFPDHTHLLY